MRWNAIPTVNYVHGTTTGVDFKGLLLWEINVAVEEHLLNPQVSSIAIVISKHAP